MTKYVLPIFKKVGQEEGLEYQVDEILRRHGFGCTFEIYHGGSEGILRSYSANDVGREDIEAHFYTEEPAKIFMYSTRKRMELAALLLFNDVSEENYSKIELAVNEQLHRAHK